MTFLLSFIVWRIIIGISLVPAFGTLYQRLTLPESTRFKDSKNIGKDQGEDEGEDEIEKLKRMQREEEEGSSAPSTPTDKKSPSSVIVESKGGSNNNSSSSSANGDAEAEAGEEEGDPEVLVKKQAHFGEFVKYFSEWRHAKLLIGTCGCWFLLDIA